MLDISLSWDWCWYFVFVIFFLGDRVASEGEMEATEGV